MKTTRIIFSWLLLVILITACSPTTSPNMAITPGVMMTPEIKAGNSPDAMMGNPAWLSTALTDVRLAKPFTINDYKGKLVVVEAMATWCPNCLEQQKQVVTLLSQLDHKDQVIMIGLDVDLNENSSMLKAYIEKQGFNWSYAVVSADIAREMGQLYGDQFLNPSATPMLMIDPKGVVHPLPFGIKSIDTLKKLIDGYLTQTT